MSNKTPNPKLSVGKPMVPISGINTKRYHLVRYETGQLMIERKGIGYRMSESRLDLFLHTQFEKGKNVPSR